MFLVAEYSPQLNFTENACNSTLIYHEVRATMTLGTLLLLLLSLLLEPNQVSGVKYGLGQGPVVHRGAEDEWGTPLLCGG